jgi:GNAT superfamily N-acetyltransferase
MRSFTCREARPEENRAVAGLLAEIMVHHGVTPPAAAELVGIVDSIMGSSQHTFFVAAVPGRLLGMCALVFSLSSWRAATVCEIQDVVVTEAARSQNIGRALIESAFEFARERGCAWVYLIAESWNLQAHDFYRTLGFQEKAVLYFEKALD